MGKPKYEVNEKDYFKDIYFLYEILNQLKGIGDIKLFFKDMLTTSELRLLKRRWHIACLLDEGWKIRRVANKAKTSTSTVIKMKHLIEEGKGGLKLALEKTRQERKEKVPVEKNAPTFIDRSSWPWVFGQTKSSEDKQI